MHDNTAASPAAYPAAINGWLDEEVGRTFAGKVTGFDQAPSRFGKDVVVVAFVDDQEDRHSLWLSSTVLVSKFGRLKPKIGERVEVTFLGLKGENNYKNYAVVAPEREPFTPDWNSMSDDEGDWGEAVST